MVYPQRRRPQPSSKHTVRVSRGYSEPAYTSDTLTIPSSFSLSTSLPPSPSLSLPLLSQTQSTATCGAAALPGQEFICDICTLAYPFEVHPAGQLVIGVVTVCGPESMQEMCGLECGHYFCRECWDSYLRVMVMCEGRGQVRGGAGEGEEGGTVGAWEEWPCCSHVPPRASSARPPSARL